MHRSLASLGDVVNLGQYVAFTLAIECSTHMVFAEYGLKPQSNCSVVRSMAGGDCNSGARRGPSTQSIGLGGAEARNIIPIVE